MDRTAFLLRRTLLCAFFACPLSFAGLVPALILHGLWSAAVSALPPCAAKRWYSGRRRPDYSRAALAYGFFIAACLLPYSLSSAYFAPFAPLFRMLCVLTGILTQCAALLWIQKAGKRPLAACLLLLSVLIACTR